MDFLPTGETIYIAATQCPRVDLLVLQIPFATIIISETIHITINVLPTIRAENTRFKLILTPHQTIRLIILQDLLGGVDGALQKCCRVHNPMAAPRYRRCRLEGLTKSTEDQGQATCITFQSRQFLGENKTQAGPPPSQCASGCFTYVSIRYS